MEDAAFVGGVGGAFDGDREVAQIVGVGDGADACVCFEALVIIKLVILETAHARAHFNEPAKTDQTALTSTIRRGS